MRIRKIVVLALLGVALAIPGVSLAKKKHGVGAGGVPVALKEIRYRLDVIEGFLFSGQGQFKDEDGDHVYVFVPDCDDNDKDVGIECPAP